MYARHLMVAVDGTKESERAVEFTVEHLCRSGDLLHLMHQRLRLAHRHLHEGCVELRAGGGGVCVDILDVPGRLTYGAVEEA